VCTGFLWQRGDTLYLITNWHCVTGWHPIEGRSLDNTGFEPELAVVSIAIADTSGKEAERLPDAKVSVALRDGDRPTWLEHPKFGRHVDVVAIGLDFRDKVEGGRLLGKPINAYDYKDLDFQVGDEAFVIGYPM
jgi:hypothetical protein